MVVHTLPMTSLAYFVAAFLLSMILAPVVLNLLHKVGARTFHRLRKDMDNTTFFQLHGQKTGTPTMGGILMVVVTAVLGAMAYPSTDFRLFLLGLLLFSGLGLADDVSKLLVKSGRRTRDLDATPKFIIQWLFALLLGTLLYVWGGKNGLGLPFLGQVYLSVLYIPIAAFVIVFFANALNITDGLDGLAGGLSVISFTALLIIAILRNNEAVAGICALLGGSTLAFLILNIHPAKVFMGDVGSLALGVGLAISALLLDAIVPLWIVGGVFSIELLSSLLQIVALRMGKRIFRIAPLHHHLEALQWAETRITFLFWILGAFFAYVGILISLV